MDRHHRQELLPSIGCAGQDRLRASHALIVGVGALGSVIAESLCRAGVGTLTLVDRDVVELTNLQRQTLYAEADTGAPKPVAARGRLGAIDPAVRVRALCEDFSPATAPAIVGFEWDDAAELDLDVAPPVDVLLDGTDNFETRYLLNDVAVARDIPYVCAGVVATAGTLMTVAPGVPGRPCLRCVFPDLPAPGSEPTCDTAGVLGPAAGAVASLAAAEAIKILAGHAEQASTVLLELDAWTPRVRTIDLADAKDPACPCCAQGRFDFLDASAGEVTSLCGRRSVQITPAARGALELAELAGRLAPFGEFNASGTSLQGTFRDETGEHGPITLHVFPTGRAIIGGTTDPARARTIYAGYLGG